MPNRIALAISVCIAVGTASCAADIHDVNSPTAALVAPPAARLVDRTIQGPYASVFIRYGTNAPEARLHAAFVSGVRVIDDSRKHQTLRLEVGLSALPRILGQLKKFSWITSLAVDSSRARVESDGARAVTAERLMIRRRSQEVPWGIIFTGARAVDSATGNEGSGVKVGIIDSGIDCNGGDLSGQVYGGYDYWDEVATGCAPITNHGTAVAGIIAAANNSGGVVGMAPAVHLYSYGVIDTIGRLMSETVLAEAIDAAVADGMQVINFSISNCGDTASTTVKYAIIDAENAGVIFVAAAGNGNTGAGTCSNSDPVSGYARVSGVIAVSRFDTSLVYTANGQYGSNIVLSAPSFVDTDSLGFGSPIYHNFPGTSAATPHVTGAIALALHAGYTVSGALSLLESYARPGPGQSGRDSHYGFGQVYLGALLAAPTLDSMRYCTSGNYNIVNNDSLIDGTHCLFRAYTAHGAPPVQVRYKVITSVLNDTTVYSWGPDSQELFIPPTIGGVAADSSGYTMTVVAYTRDSVLQRGTDSVFTSFYVCNVTAGVEIRTVARPSFAWGGPDLPAGCTGGDLRAKLGGAGMRPIAPLVFRQIQAVLAPKRDQGVVHANGVWPFGTRR